MFGKSMEIKRMAHDIEERDKRIKSLNLTLSELNNKIQCLENEIKLSVREREIITNEKLAKLRESMQESLIKSDLLRTEALAKLEVYEKTDTKSDANTIKEMIGRLIEVIGKQNISVIK